MPSVTRSPAAARRAGRAAVEAQVLAAVERLLAAGESFTTLGIARIAAEAGMARTTFYGHFADKPTLLVRLAAAATSDLFATATAWTEDPDRDLAGLEQTVARLLAEYRRHAPLLQALAEVAAYEPEVEAFWRRTVDAFAGVIERYLERDRAAGRAPAALDPASTAVFLAWGTERTLAMHVRAQPDPATDAALARGIAAATWAAMGRTG